VSKRNRAEKIDPKTQIAGGSKKKSWAANGGSIQGIGLTRIYPFKIKSKPMIVPTRQIARDLKQLDLGDDLIACRMRTKRYIWASDAKAMTTSRIMANVIPNIIYSSALS
jgi:ABC-type enterobactin transport system permease subunit